MKVDHAYAPIPPRRLLLAAERQPKVESDTPAIRSLWQLRSSGRKLRKTVAGLRREPFERANSAAISEKILR